MRFQTLALALLCLSAGALRASDLELRRVWPQWRDSVEFQSLYEDRTGTELAGNWTVLRSRPDKRSGLYFLTRTDNRALPVEAASFVLHVIAPDSVDTHVYTFPAKIPHGSRLFEIGLTGADWRGPKAAPVAWLLEVLGPDGRVLARKASYLWEMPERPAGR